MFWFGPLCSCSHCGFRGFAGEKNPSMSEYHAVSQCCWSTCLFDVLNIICLAETRTLILWYFLWQFLKWAKKKLEVSFIFTSGFSMSSVLGKRWKKLCKLEKVSVSQPTPWHSDGLYTEANTFMRKVGVIVLMFFNAQWPQDQSVSLFYKPNYLKGISSLSSVSSGTAVNYT